MAVIRAERLESSGWPRSVPDFRLSVLSVTTNSPVNGTGLIEDQRADLILPGNGFLVQPTANPGGLVLLNQAAFREPADPSIVGTTGRNAFRGPGLYNSDISVSRTFRLPRLKESAAVTFRADAFNVLNHANLNNPDNLYGSPTFGIHLRASRCVLRISGGCAA